MRRGSGQRNKLARLGRKKLPRGSLVVVEERSGDRFLWCDTPVWCLLSMCLRVLKNEKERPCESRSPPGTIRAAKIPGQRRITLETREHRAIAAL